MHSEYVGNWSTYRKYGSVQVQPIKAHSVYLFWEKDVPSSLNLLSIFFPQIHSDVARLGRPSLTSLTNADKASSPTNEGKSTASAKRPTNEAGGKAAGASGGKMPKWFAAGKKK